MRKELIICLYLFFTLHAGAQDMYMLWGRVSDSLSGEPLVGASVITGEKSGTITDADGLFRAGLTVENQIITIQYLGYLPLSIPLNRTEDDSIFLEIYLLRSVTALDEIVVSAGRYEQRLSEVMVSVDIIKPERIENTGTISLESILRQSPGVEILDGQPGIRGGSGYSYGAGSRVLVLLDDIPILSGDVGDVKWDYLPVENIEQVEIIKGASSVLYGASALNGVFNIRTSYPGSVPRTRLSLFSGLYSDPARKETVWWDRRPLFAGFEFSHNRKIDNLDLVIGGNLFRDEGYREDEFIDRERVNVGLRQRSSRVRGLSYGLNANGMLVYKSDFLLWRDSRSGTLRQNPLSVSALTGNRFNVDPFMEYRKGYSHHSLKTRYFHIKNDFADTPDKNNKSEQVYGEYRYQRKFIDGLDLALGLAGTSTNSVAALYGNHSSMNAGIFGQADGKITEDLNLSLGVRFERYALDGEVEFSTPVFRAGMNYKVLENTYLRASFGQGYRFPSVAEKYTATNVGALRIFPNPDLVSETGWSTELGVKQGLKIGRWQGYLDLAAFLTEYSNMIEFVFDVYQVDSLNTPTLDDYGFMAQNVGNARITGIELTLYGGGRAGSLPLSLMAGYTYLNPVDPDAKDILKYRYRHSLKWDVEVKAGRFSVGSSFVLASRMERIDDVFTDPLFGNIILPGFPSYWDTNNNGYAVLDARVLCNITTFFKVGLILKNALNKEYLGRPGDIQPPRNITLRLTAEF